MRVRGPYNGAASSVYLSRIFQRPIMVRNNTNSLPVCVYVCAYVINSFYRSSFGHAACMYKNIFIVTCCITLVFMYGNNFDDGAKSFSYTVIAHLACYTMLQKKVLFSHSSVGAINSK